MSKILNPSPTKLRLRHRVRFSRSAQSVWIAPNLIATFANSPTTRGVTRRGHLGERNSHFRRQQLVLQPQARNACDYAALRMPLLRNAAA